MIDFKIPSALRPAGPTITTGHTGPHMSERKTCETCEHWHGRIGASLGECRRYPKEYHPQRVWGGASRMNYQLEAGFYYTPMEPHEWCGEHKTKDDAR